MLAPHLVLLQRGQRAQAEVEDRPRLLLGEPELGHQRLARRIGVGRVADDRDHAVEVVERDQVALEDVQPALRPLEPELGAPGDDFLLVVDVVPQQGLEPERARRAADQADDVGAERRLQRRVLVELREHDLGQLAALQLDPDPHAVAVGLVGDVADAGDDLLVHELGDLREHAVVAALAHLVRQLRDDDRVVAALLRLDVRDGPHADAAAAGLVGVADALQAHDQRAGREIGALDVLHQALGRDLGIVDQRDRAGDDLAQVVRRDVRRHADGDAGRAVREQIREARRHDRRHQVLLVVVGLEVDDVLVEVAQHLDGDRRQAALRVAHGRGGVAVDVAEVALRINQRVARRERLSQAHERVVDRGVAMGMVLAHAITDDPGALHVRPVRLQAEVLHRVEDAPVDGLEAVADIGQSAPDDHAHRVIHVRGAHLLYELAILDVPVAQVDGCQPMLLVLSRRRGT